MRRRVPSLPIPPRLLLAAPPKLVTPVLQVVHCVLTRLLLGPAGLKADEADSGVVTLIQRLGSAANLNIHLHCLVRGGVYRQGADGTPEFVEAPAPTDEAPQTVLHNVNIASASSKVRNLKVQERLKRGGLVAMAWAASRLRREGRILSGNAQESAR